jgi:TRAP-type C4-dicarboxylate transport system substrate-binding protein
MSFLAPPLQIHTKDVEITDIDQLEGIRVVSSGILDNVANRLGMSPASVAHPDIHSALQSGTVGAVFSPLAATYSNSWNDVVNYCTTNLNIGGFPIGIVMGTDTLNELPSPVKEAIITAGNETVAEYASNVQQGIQDVVMTSEKVAEEKPFDKSGQYLAYETEPADDIDSTIEPVVEEWVNSHNNSSGAQEAVDTLRSLQEEYR